MLCALLTCHFILQSNEVLPNKEVDESMAANKEGQMPVQLVAEH